MQAADYNACCIIDEYIRRHALNVLLIANQPRLQHIVADAAARSGSALAVATTLDLPEEHLSTPPAIIFLQNRLSGLSAEILARHIRSQLGAAEGTTLVILSESPTDSGEEIMVGVSVPDEELVQAIADLMANATDTATGAGGFQPVASPFDGESVPGKSGAEATEPFHPKPDDSTVPEDTVTIGNASPVAPGQHAPSSPPLNFQEELDTLIGAPSPPAEDVDTVQYLRKRMERISDRPVDRTVTYRPFLMAGVATAAVAAVIVFFLTRETPSTVPSKPAVTVEQEKKAAPVTTITPASPSTPTAAIPPDTQAVPAPVSAPAQEPSRVGPTGLPRFVPPSSAVADYGKSHPGWEQYLTPDFEFRIFRSGKHIMALQAIDRTGRGMSRSFFTRAILELAGVRDYRLLAKEVKGGYLVKKGSLAGTAGVILYKNSDDTQLRAFVIHYQ